MSVLSSAISAGAAESDLLRGLRSPDRSTKLAAIDRLGQKGGDVEGAVGALAVLLADDSALVRAHAASALGQIGPAAKPAVEALAKALFDENATVRREAIEAFGKIRPGPEVSGPLVIKLFEQADPELLAHVLSSIAEFGGDAVGPFTKALENEKGCYWACLVLGEIGPDAAPAVPALVKLARSDKRPEVRREAILALAGIGPKAAPAVPMLIEALGEKEGLNTGAAAFALGAIGPEAKPAEAKLKQLADSDDSSTMLGTVCGWALARINPDDKQLLAKVLPKLVDALTSPKPEQRAAAARALAELNPDPAMLRPLLSKAMAAAGPEARDEILDAIATLGKEAVPRLIEVLQSDPAARPRAAAIIARIGPEAKQAVPALVGAMSDRNVATRIEVLFALAAVGPEAKAAVPAATGALDDPDRNVRYAACLALGSIGPAADSAKARLLAHLPDKDRFMAMSSAWALARIDPACPELAAKIAPVLAEALGESDAMTRLHAAKALRDLGPLAKAALSALKEAGNDEDEDVRKMVAEAIKAIGQ